MKQIFISLASLLVFCLPSEASAQSDAPVLPTEYDALAEMAQNHTLLQQEFHMGTWGLGEGDRWNIDLETQKIWWTFEDKIVEADLEVLGTWSGRDNSFLWGWDHPSVPQSMRNATIKTKAYADEHDIDELKDSMTNCDFEDCWEIASIAGLIGDLDGIYRGEAGGSTWIYMGFNNITLKPLEE